MMKKKSNILWIEWNSGTFNGLGFTGRKNTANNSHES